MGPLALGAFLKVAGVVGTGGQAKVLAQSGEIMVNGEIERRRGRMLVVGDVISAAGVEYRVCSSPS